MKNNKKFNYEEVSILVNQDRSKGFHKRIYKKKPELRRVVEMVKIKQGRFLDIGCGGGLVTECLPFYYPKVKIYGCDISKTAIKHAKKYGTGKVSYKVFNKQLPYPSNYFDAVTCIDVLEHVPNEKYFVREIKRVLKKGGVLFCAVPCEGERFTVSWLFNKIGFWQNLTEKHVGHIHPEFTHDYIINFFEKNGFSVVTKSFSERIPVQFLRYSQFLIPKEIMELVLGRERASRYNDSSDLRRGTGERVDLIMNFKKLWYKLRGYTKVIDDIDAEYLRNVKFGAWKINILLKNEKKHA